jgi:hypothetical protein
VLLRTVPFGVTEEALRLLHATHGDFTRLPPPSRRGRLRAGSSTALGPYDFAQVRAQSEYLRLVSIVEAFVDTCCNHLFDLKTQGHDMFVRNLAAAARDQASINWEERKSAFATFHHVPLGNCASYSDVAAAVQVRNAVAHGLGSLTRRQQNKKDMTKIASVGINFRNQALVIDARALDRCVRFSAAFVADVDARIPR